MDTWIQRLRRKRWGQDFLVTFIVGVVRVLAALPPRWIPWIGDRVGEIMYFIDSRGRRVGRQNLRVVFGGRLSGREERRILRAAARQMTRSILLLFHLQPMTAKRYRRWVDVPEDYIRTHPFYDRLKSGGVLVSGHFGNWELMLGIRVLFPEMPEALFLAEEISHPALDRVARRLRDRNKLAGAFRRGGAQAALKTVKEGRILAMLVDRNVRSYVGGIYVPFFGIPARTTPLPGWLATRLDAPVFPLFCLPTEDDRYRIWLGPDLTGDLQGETEDERVREVLTRMNGVLEDLIRARPELWNWTLKRWKSRPTTELAGHPPYSEFDPD